MSRLRLFGLNVSEANESFTVKSMDADASPTTAVIVPLPDEEAVNRPSLYVPSVDGLTITVTGCAKVGFCAESTA